jgi:hypothetical protein
MGIVSIPIEMAVAREPSQDSAVKALEAENPDWLHVVADADNPDQAMVLAHWDDLDQVRKAAASASEAGGRKARVLVTPDAI